MNDGTLSYDIFELDKGRRVVFFVFTAPAFMAVAFLFYQNVLVCLLASFCCFPLEKYYKNCMIRKRKEELNYQFRDALYSISSSVATGRQMIEAMEEACENLKLIYQEEALIVKELIFIVVRVRERNEPEEEVLRDFARRSGLSDIQQFVDVYFTCRVTGGDLEKVLQKTAGVIIDKINIEKEIHMLTSQKRLEAKLLTTIPFIVLFFLKLTSSDYLQVMYETLLGKGLMTVAIVMIAFAHFLSIKITDIKI